MLKLRNAVLTALLAFCLAMPFVSCSFNDGATGDVSNLVKEQPGNNQNGGNGGSTGGNEKPSGGDEDSGDNGNENPSGGNNGGSGNENPSGGNEKPTDPTEPGAGTTYVVIYNGHIIEESLPESMWFYGVEEVNLEEGVDYTMKGNEITLTYSGYQKVLPLLESSGGDGGQEVIPPVTDVPVPDVPGDVEGTMYTVKYGDTVIVPAMPESALSGFAQDYGLVEGTDYTFDGTVITLTESGFNKLLAAGSGE
ncbi:hypothetical protein [Treponema porcinum]|uniref:hypothetical protein n=1 Tax=Treponema porcinum TaxID=261392 RepID=UPI0023F2F401|nr:hypothetical protein [Treponema porcinum]MDD7125533.1 hypothetical protein [Treponema porcinum]MDY5454312.1 hypothetical protein [Treponema porcinum]